MMERRPKTPKGTLTVMNGPLRAIVSACSADTIKVSEYGICREQAPTSAVREFPEAEGKGFLVSRH